MLRVARERAPRPDRLPSCVHSLVLPAVRFGPGCETLPQAIAAIGMLCGDIALLQRIGLQIVELVAPIVDAVDVLPVRLANRKPEMILGDVEVRASRMARVEQAAPLPVR